MLVTVALVVAISGCPGDPDGAARLKLHESVTRPSNGTRGDTLVTKYSLIAEGLDGEEATTADLASGKFVSTYSLGVTSGGSGFDGETGWSRDLAARHSYQRGGDKPALARNEAYRIANLWWRADRGGARIESVDCATLRVTPRGGKAFDVSFIPTGELATLREARSWNSMVIVAYSDWRATSAGRIAGRIETTTNGDVGTLEVRTLRDAQLRAAQPAAAYARPADAPADKLPGGRVTVPFRLLNNHVVVDVSVNGTAPRPFIVDTGGHLIVTPATAAAIGLRAEGRSVSGGSGEKTVTSGYARVQSLAVGGAALRDAVVLVLEFSPRDVEGLDLGGMIGSEFLERHVVELDYGKNTMTLIDPRAFGERERNRAGTAVPMNFYDHMPQIEGSFEGTPARFNIDTGSRSDVSITAPFVARAQLRSRFPDGVSVTDGWGVGGPARSFVVRAQHMNFGPVEISRPLASLSIATRGVMADDNFDGNVGSGLLKRFVATFDYPGEKLYLRRLAQPDVDASRFDRTGVWINLGEGGVEVKDVAKDGPAAAAGIVPGDVITAIGARDTAAMQLSDVRRALKLLPDEPVRIRFRRGQEPREAMLTPRALVPD